jgi:2'-hydroxyisoflavone reductase
MPTRRDFLKTTAAAGGVLLAGVVPASLHAAGATAPGRARKPMDLLILGGTGFIGPHIVREAISRGHRVTIFTRGRRDAELPPEVIRLVGDRNGKLDALVGKRWDAVIDDSATNPDWVQQSTQLLKDSVGRYLFTSSTGVYYPYLTRGVDESTPVRYEQSDPKDGSESYAVSKARCERTVMQTFGDRGVVVRPTYIVGPGDTTDRFPYWPVRIARGGEVLAPGRRDDPVQVIDVRDLAAFMVRLLEDGRSGAYNAAGPRSTLTMPAFLETARKAVGSDARFTYVDDYDFLAAHGIVYSVPWVMLRGNENGHTSAKNDRALAAGLTFRPLEATVRDTLAWWPTVPEERRTKAQFAIKPEQESKALADWHALGK